MSFPQNVIYYGDPKPLVGSYELVAGQMTMALEDGDLRYIRCGEYEKLRRIYVAVRDHNWSTIPPQYSNWKRDIQPNTFHISFDAVHERGELDFFWHGEIRGDANSTITFSMDGIARSTFRRNRIGFCALLPAASAGARARVVHWNETAEQARLPNQVSLDQPVLPFAEMRSIAYEVAPAIWSKVEFEGEVFEMEDQRNWTDASFKIFGTPLRLPFPVQVERGTRLRQTLTVTLDGPRIPRAVVTSPEPEPITITLGTGSKPLPELGLEMASHQQALASDQIERLKRLRLSHLRAQIRLTDPDWGAVLTRATEQADALALPLEVALPLCDMPASRLAAFRAALDERRPAVKRWLITPEPEHYQGGALFDRLIPEARVHLQSYSPNAVFAGGTDTDFIFLARNAAALGSADALCFAINPQTHATDLASVVETLAAQVAPIQTAQTLAHGRPVIVSPITLKPRFNAYATGSAPRVPAGELPPQVDARQLSLFGAGWTLGSYKYVAHAGAASVTYFETTGWRGVMETASGSAVPKKFPSQPGMIFPMYFVFQIFGEMRGGSMRDVGSDDPLRVEALAVEQGAQTTLLVCNFTNVPQKVRLQDMPAVPFGIARLNEFTIERTAVDGFEQDVQAGLRVNGSVQTLELLPFEITRLDWRMENRDAKVDVDSALHT